MKLFDLLTEFWMSEVEVPCHVNCCYKLESKDPRLSFIQTGDQPDLDPSSSPGARHITVLYRNSHPVEAPDSRSRRARIALLSEYAATLY
ncbi:hypothetical protein J6590_052953 [Homalodisca vitripennis]|nr:hypothetical protein J6590_052953 [Homalodisca vitripennis]